MDMVLGLRDASEHFKVPEQKLNKNSQICIFVLLIGLQSYGGLFQRYFGICFAKFKKSAINVSSAAALNF